MPGGAAATKESCIRPAPGAEICTSRDLLRGLKRDGTRARAEGLPATLERGGGLPPSLGPRPGGLEQGGGCISVG